MGAEILCWRVLKSYVSRADI